MERGPPAPPFHFDYGEEDEGRSRVKPSEFSSSLFSSEISVPLLIVGVGKVPSDTLRTRLVSDGATPSAKIVTRTEKVLGKYDEEDIVEEDVDISEVFSLERGGILVLCENDKVPIEDVNSWVKKLFQHIKASEVIVLSEQPMFRFRSEDYIYDRQFLRELHTSDFHNHSSVLPLTPPNIVDGLAAAILSRCEITNTPGQLFVSFREGNSSIRSLDLPAFECFEPVYSLSNLGPFVIRSKDDAVKAYQIYVKSALSKPMDALLYM